MTVVNTPSWETLFCTFIHRFKSTQLISYNIETFISSFNTQKPRVSYSHQSQKAALFIDTPKQKSKLKKYFHISSCVKLQVSLFSLSIRPFTEQCK